MRRLLCGADRKPCRAQRRIRQGVVDWLPLAESSRRHAASPGAYYRCTSGRANGSADTNEWNAKSSGAFAATDLLMHYYVTRDPGYAQTIYEPIRQIATFWRDYLVKDGTRYVITNDAQQEGDAYRRRTA